MPPPVELDMPPPVDVDMPPPVEVDMPPPVDVDSPPPVDVLRFRGQTFMRGGIGLGMGTSYLFDV
jgi:hypothetical protein